MTLFFYILASAIAILDQVIKYLVHESMVLGQSLPLLDGILKLTYVRNTGAAFSLFVGFSPYLTVVGIAVMLVVIYFHHRIPSQSYVLQTGLAFILGGSLGNLIDRIFRGFVIDYLDVGIWPVFNFADIMINAGVILVAFKLFTRERKDVSDSV